ncbi:hypothetical protein B0H17DRAFT_1333854 [Mycena rosella]|uniref:Uncharacterized protein n=1 Tax=Mycena rosella TaxID=1033263 RepID=A0AAD7D5Q5_MYCRO|nr:hypothetical protein B0H17DRAFT_1333854 [Mycena rosella]
MICSTHEYSSAPDSDTLLYQLTLYLKSRRGNAYASIDPGCYSSRWTREGGTAFRSPQLHATALPAQECTCRSPAACCRRRTRLRRACCRRRRLPARHVARRPGGRAQHDLLGGRPRRRARSAPSPPPVWLQRHGMRQQPSRLRQHRCLLQAHRDPER